MPNIISIPGMDYYEDENAVSDVLHYCVHSGLTMDYDTRYVTLGENTNLMARQFQMVHRVHNYNDGKKLHHFVIGFGDWFYITPENLRYLMKLVLDYFSIKGFQIVGAIQLMESDNKWYQHIHFVLNHVAQNGDLFYGDNTDYKKLAAHLEHFSEYRFTYEGAHDYNDDYDYEKWMKNCFKQTYPVY